MIGISIKEPHYHHVMLTINNFNLTLADPHTLIYIRRHHILHCYQLVQYFDSYLIDLKIGRKLITAASARNGPFCAM